jgi:hypothetical protein
MARFLVVLIYPQVEGICVFTFLNYTILIRAGQQHIEYLFGNSMLTSMMFIRMLWSILISPRSSGDRAVAF